MRSNNIITAAHSILLFGVQPIAHVVFLSYFMLSRQVRKHNNVFMIYYLFALAIGIAASTIPLKSSSQFSISIPHKVDWIRQHLATKSPYQKETLNEALPVEPGCELVRYHSIIRHGTRWPTAKDTMAIKNVVARLLMSKSEQVEWLTGWENPFTFEKAGYLHTAGQEELFTMGQRFGRRYKQLLETIDFDNDDLQFASGAQSRTSRSGSAFHLGLLEQTGGWTSAAITPVAWTTYPKTKDTYMQMSHTCPRWVSEVSNNPNTTYQAQIWVDTIIAPIASRLSAKLQVELTVDHVDAIYTACAFETSFYHSSSHWCKLLSADDILALEYTDDLLHYYKYSYGNEINQWVASDLMQLLMHMLQDVKAPRISFQFGHSQTILFLQTLLELNRDNFTLRADTPVDQIRQREFKTARLSPFAANIGFELYECKGSRYIRTLLLEKEVKLPCCDEPMCGFSQFKTWVDEKLNRGYNAVCKLDPIYPA